MTRRARAFYLLKKSDKSDFIRLFKIRSTALVMTNATEHSRETYYFVWDLSPIMNHLGSSSSIWSCLMTEEKYGKKYGKVTPRSPNPREILTRPCIQCMTHQMSKKQDQTGLDRSASWPLEQGSKVWSGLKVSGCQGVKVSRSQGL